MLLRFKLDKDGFRFTNPADLITARSIDYIKCKFEIADNDAWESVDAIIAVFKSPTYNKHSEILLDSSGCCFIDPEVYKHGGTIQVKLIGDRYLDEEVISSSTVTSVLEFTINENIILPVTTPSMYSIMIAELENSKAAVDKLLAEVAYKLAHDGFKGVGIERIVFNLDSTLTIVLTDGTSFNSIYSLKGPKGDKGDPAGFGVVEASVDDRYGTPSVDVVVSGEDTAKNFSFEFHNLKQAPYDDSTLVARMDSFTNLAEGSTSGDAELIDGRIVDGKTYANIGEAIRAVNSHLKNDLGFLAPLSDIVVENSDWEIGGLSSNDGRDGTNLYTIRTNRFYLFSGYLFFSGVSRGAGESTDRVIWVYAYDRDGGFLGRASLANRTSVWVALEGTAYIRFVYGFTSASGIKVEDYGKDLLISEWSMDILSKRIDYISSKGEIFNGDLNDYTDNGIYVLSNADALATANTPGNFGGVLTVIKPDIRAVVWYQMYMQNDNELFVRFKTSARWMDWFSVVGRQGLLPFGTDLNDVAIHGTYSIVNAIVPSLSNYPSDQGGVLVMYTPRPTGFPKVQILYTYDGRVYTRAGQSTGYTDWSNATNTLCDTSKEARIISSTLRKLFLNSVVVGSTLPKENGQIGVTEYYNSGDEIKGILYSSAWREGNDVYWNKTLETYYSALANPASILYTDDITDMGIYNAHAVWGGVCSTFVSYVLNFPFYTTTADLASRLVDKEMDSLDEIEVGDILLKSGHIAIISQVYTDDKGALVSVDVSEQTLPRFHTTNVPFNSLESYLDRNGYVVKQNTFGKPRNIGKPEYASDIIFEHGNNTYVDITDTAEMWFYIPDGHSVFYKKDDAGEYIEVLLTSVPSRTVNGVTVYNLASIFISVGDYLLTTNIDNVKQCLIKVIDVGMVTIVNGVLTLSGYLNCTPKQYYMVDLVSGESDKSFDPPEGYHADFPNKHHYIESDTVTIEDIPVSGKYKLCIDYETGVGYKRILSDNIGI